MADVEVLCEVSRCGKPEREHYMDTPWAHRFMPPPPGPEPHEIVPALTVTTWTCPHCHREQDVWGEGAVNTWMDCGWGCPASWLSLDAGMAEALGLAALDDPTPVRSLRGQR